MKSILLNVFRRKVTENFKLKDAQFEKLGIELKQKIDSVFGRSIAIRVVDAGSDNSPEIELVNLTTPHYDVERFGVSFVASPRHADVLIVTGPVTYNMAIALKKTYDAVPAPKWVIAVGDDACGGGIFKDSYAVMGGADKILPVDVRITGNPPSPKEILKGIIALMEAIKNNGK
jgi:Ni,Fe-hydrogenase III small subunit